MDLNKTYTGCTTDVLPTLPAGSVHCCVTSPPYFGLRNYGVPPTEWPEIRFSILGFEVVIPAMTCCLGLENTPMEFVGHIVHVFRDVKRVLRDDGTLWLNIGDSYSFGKVKMPLDRNRTVGDLHFNQDQSVKRGKGVKTKDLIGIPAMIAFALRDDGWYWRQDIIWHKNNPMPESITDRCTRAHEYLLLFSKKKRYFFDYVAIQTPCKTPQDDVRRKMAQREDNKSHPDKLRNGIRKSGNKERKTGSERMCPEGTGSNVCSSVPWEGAMANKRSVWTIPTRPFMGAHFATFPEMLPVDCIKAGTSEHGCCAQCGAPYRRLTKKTLVPTDKASFNSKVDARDNAADARDRGSNFIKDGHQPGMAYITVTIGWRSTCKCGEEKVVPAVVLDPFHGAGTVGLVAEKLHRRWIGVELSPNNVDLSVRRITK